MTTKNRIHEQAELNKMCAECDVNLDCIDEIEWYGDTAASITSCVTTIGGAVLAGGGTYLLAGGAQIHPVNAPFVGFATAGGAMIGAGAAHSLAPRVGNFCCNIILARRQAACLKASEQKTSQELDLVK